MTKLNNLIKINAREYLNFYKILNASNSKERAKEIFKFIFIVLIYSIFGFYIFMFAKLSMETFKTLHIEYVLLGEFFAIASIMTLLSSIFLVDNLLYNSKDYDLLNSLPIKKSTIIISKMLNLYFSNLLFTLVIMIPILIVYVLNVRVSLLFYFLYLFSMLVLPLIPTIIAVILGSLISFITTRFKSKKFWQFLTMLASVGLYLFISFKTNNLDEFSLATLGESFVKIFNKIYPLTGVYLDLLTKYDLKAIIIFLIVPLILYIITISIISLLFKNIISKMGERKKKKVYHLTHVKEHHVFTSLLKKEAKRFFSSPVYIFNSGFSVILLLGMSIILLFVSPHKIEEFMGIPGMLNLVKAKGPLLIGFVLMFSCTSSSSISLEGKSISILKSLPILEKNIFLSKITFNFFLLFIPGTITSLIITYILKLPFSNFILFIITIALYAFFISILGLIINLHFPVLYWKNEVRVIKQSLATFLTITCSFAFGIIPLILNLKFSINQSILIIDLAFLILSIILAVYLDKIGKKLWQKLA